MTSRRTLSAGGSGEGARGLSLDYGALGLVDQAANRRLADGRGGEADEGEHRLRAAPGAVLVERGGAGLDAVRDDDGARRKVVEAGTTLEVLFA